MLALCVLAQVALAQLSSTILSVESSGRLTISLTNAASDDVQLLRWNLPFERVLESNIFQVQCLPANTANA